MISSIGADESSVVNLHINALIEMGETAYAKIFRTVR